MVLGAVVLISIVVSARIRTATCIFLFNFMLVLCTVPTFMVGKFTLLTSRCKPVVAGSRRRRLVFQLADIFWRLLLSCCCWIRIKSEGRADFCRTAGSTGRPVVLVANHLSFLDTILLVSMTPLRHIFKLKMLVSAHLTKIPAIGSVVLAMGHILVPFKNDQDLEVDREAMLQRQQDLENYVRGGGWAAWFPEGKMNSGPDCSQVGLFRAGGFSLCCRVDAEIWCVAFSGNDHCWPRKASVGGRPARMGIKFMKLCDSSFAFAAAAGDEKEACKKLANAAHDKIQDAVNEFVAMGYAGRPSSVGLRHVEEPLVPK